MDYQELEEKVNNIYKPLLEKFDYVLALKSPLFQDNGVSREIDNYIQQLDNAKEELIKISQEISKTLREMFIDNNFDNYYKLVHLRSQIDVMIRNLEFFKYRLS